MGAPVGTDLDRAARLLAAGELVAIPTETVYGLAATATDAEAVLGIFAAKQRPAFDPLIVHLRDIDQAATVAAAIPDEARALMEAFWPGPLTLVLPKAPAIPDEVTSGLDTVGLRQPDHPLTAALLARLEAPLAAPSANLFGRVSPTTAEHVVEQLGDRLAYVLDGGPCRVGLESTIVGWEDGAPVLYRPGGVALEALEAVLGTVAPARRRILPAAPGMLAAHYAPATPLVLGDLDALLAAHTGRRLAVLSFREARPAHASRVLSPDGDLTAAAQRLFAALRTLDASGAELILAEPVPDEDLGRAINDRLRRAAAARAAPPAAP